MTVPLGEKFIAQLEMLSRKLIRGDRAKRHQKATEIMDAFDLLDLHENVLNFPHSRVPV